MTLLNSLLLGACAIGAAVAQLQCGTIEYNPALYSCYDGDFLCPIISGDATKKCGDACYDADIYDCKADSTLAEKPAEDNPFTLIAHNPLYYGINGKVINGCSRHFFLRDLPCAYCPEGIGGLDCSMFSENATVLGGISGLMTTVPGGQLFYIEPNGALGFTQAHSGSYPTGSTFGSVKAYEDGEFIIPGTSGWYACGDDNQIFAALPGLEFSCIPLRILTAEWPYGTPVWQYT
ncbi:carbohydrate-binding module family 52 protein [Aulographum hederae CBS 113979]|uniref:Carbohydrate-binding module family 52 protein n=1 Tax=Aulographum hederae CBS 113979 TaxID=1176131 RepID=A0A6G1GQS8_9PEZI|nr:carbohydrate-binding module family 52 protein [Aulographum hederae CBS 113979]